MMAGATTGTVPPAPRPRQRRSIPLASWGLSVLVFVLAAIAWEVVARAGIFPPKLFPTLEKIWVALVRVAENGTLWASIVATLTRLLLGFLLAGVVGVVVGILMGRHAWFEDLMLPVVSFMYPIPGIAYAPLFVLWFGLGDLPSVLLVGVASCFIVIINTWRGVKGVKPLWLRCATVMGASHAAIFFKVVLPAALPSILAGLRLGLAGAWRILIAVEMLMSVQRGLGWMIFGSQQFLNTDVMLATIAVIGVIGLLLEKQVFERIERRTTVRWGMMKG